MKQLLVCLLLAGVVGYGSEPDTEVAPTKDLPGSSFR
jgi:hypothetical protein